MKFFKQHLNLFQFSGHTDPLSFHQYWSISGCSLYRLLLLLKHPTCLKSILNNTFHKHLDEYTYYHPSWKNSSLSQICLYSPNNRPAMSWGYFRWETCLVKSSRDVLWLHLLQCLKAQQYEATNACLCSALFPLSKHKEPSNNVGFLLTNIIISVYL